MDYTQLITQALSEKNWDNVIKLAIEAKHKEDGQIFLGIRKGYANIIYGYNNQVDAAFKEAGVKTLDACTQLELNKLIKAGDLSLDSIKAECIIIFARKATVVSKLVNLGYPINYFTMTIKYSGVKGTEYTNTYGQKDFKEHEHICTFKNKITGESMKFKLNSKNIFTAILRDTRIESLFDEDEL